MTPQRWQQIKDLLHAASERPPAERQAWLAAQCGDDVALLGEVESLLAQHHETDSFMRRPLVKNPAATSNELRPGEHLGPYQIEQRIGAGGMGVVYRALDSRLERPVALKLLPAAFTDDAKRLRRFRQEARAISALNHPNILTIHEIGEAETTTGVAYFIATELVEGRNLRTALQDGDLTLGFVLEVLIQAVTALAAAHAAGVVHRDIKPENLMVRPDGVVKVLDFGLAKVKLSNAATAFSAVHTNPGLVMGTVNYMSPEQARGLETDERTDVFSLGVVAYELLTGRTPFEGATTSDVLAALLEREPPPLSASAPHLPADLQRIIHRALAKDRAARYQKCTELLADLKALRQELEVTAHLKRLGDTPVEAASLSLRVGHSTAEKAAASTADAPTVVTGAVTKPNFFRRLSPPVRWAVVCLPLLLVFALAGSALYRYTRGKESPAIRSVAVLPFVNVNGDAQMEYLADGMSESLMQSLSQLPELRVMSRGATFAYKGREVDPRQVGQDLAVDAVVTGRLQPQGERLTLQVEMASAADGARLWSGRYERPSADLPTAQTEMAREISIRLQTNLRKEERRQLAVRSSDNSEANRLYLQARHLHLRMTRENFPQVLDLYQRAVAADPRFALAYSGIAHAYADASGQYLPPKEAMPQAKQAALTAVSLQDDLPEAHLALGLVKHWGDWDWQGAETEYQRALQLNPNFSEAHSYYSTLLALQKRLDEAVNETRRAEELDPVAASYSVSTAKILYAARQFERAEQGARQMLAQHPEGVAASNAHNLLGQALVPQGRLAEALTAFRQAVAYQPSDANLAWLAYVLARAGQTAEARKILREMTARAQHTPISPVTLARIHLGLGDHEKALAALRKSYDDHSDQILRIHLDAIYDPLRNDPRFQEMVRGFGLSQ